MRENVVFLVWDACRLDTIDDHAPTLRSLGEDNLFFERAVTPAGASLGSHVSMFTGQYPHEHGVYEQSDSVESALPLVRELGEQGYERYGISANGFAAPKFGFDRGFEQFYNTQGLTVSPEGLDVHRYARKVREENHSGFDVSRIDYADLVTEIVTHERPGKSFLNVAAAGLSELTSRYPRLRTIPHPRFDRYNEFCYDPEQNTELIEKTLERAADTQQPFFLFANYMDTHHPYAPRERLQRAYCGRTFSYGELSDIADRTHPYEFLRAVHEGDQLTEEELRTVRDLYYGEVRTVDEHLSRVLTALEVNGLREDTLVVVTADHGENLGERNAMRERHMGHICSASDHHLRVPLVVAHPALESARIDEFVSIKDLRYVLTEGRRDLIDSGGTELGPLGGDEPVVSEVTTSGNDVLGQRYPELRDVLNRNLVASYTGEWKVVMGSTGETFAWESGQPRDLDAAPQAVVDACRSHLSKLEEIGDADSGLSKSEISHLESLGYL